MEKDGTKIKRANLKKEYFLIAAGLAFFFNPTVNIIDVLPDALGAILVYMGLERFGYIDDKFENAKKLSFYMIWLYIVKHVLSLAVFENTSNTLPFTFFASVLEIIILTAFFGLFYSGFEYTLMRRGNGESVKAVANVKTYSVFFVFAKNILAFLPETLELFRQKEQFNFDADASYRFPISSLKPYVILSCVTLCLILGVIYLIRTFAFLNKVRKDEAYTENLTAEFTEILEHKRGKLIRRKMNLSCFCFGCAALFSADAVFEGKDFLPGIVSAIALALSFLAFSEYSKTTAKQKVSLILITVFCALDTVFLGYLEPLYTRVFSAEKISDIEGAEFIKSGFGAAFSIIGEIALAVFMIIGVAIWIKKCKKITDDLGTSYGRSAFWVSVFFSASAVFKAARTAINVLIVHMAFADEGISNYLSLRSMMSPQSSGEYIAQNPGVAAFESLDGVYSVIGVAGLVLAAVAVINMWALKSRVNGEV